MNKRYLYKCADCDAGEFITWDNTIPTEWKVVAVVSIGSHTCKPNIVGVQYTMNLVSDIPQ